MTLTDGQILKSRFKIIRHIKSGGMGAVYEAFDMALKGHVVIKENLRTDESLAFEREAQLLANLRHKSLPRCIDLFMLEDKQYLVMEFIEGDDLSTLLSSSQTPLKAKVVLDWAKQLLDVLDYLHGEAVLHRDIKPSNITEKDGRVYLIDFGLAYGESGEMDTINPDDFNWSCYSHYSSPEQLGAARTYPSSDLYSLAATLYKLLTGVPPVNATSRLRTLADGKDDPIEDIRLHNAELDENVSRTLMLSLSIDPKKRPQSAREMRRMMFPKKTSRPKPVVRQNPNPVRTRSFSRKKVFAGILMLCALLALLIPALAMREQVPADRATNQPQSPAPSARVDPSIDEAERLMQSGKHEEAKKLLTKLLSLYPDNAYVHYIYGDLLWDFLDEMAESVANMPEVQEQAAIILRLVQSPNSEKEFVARAWAYLAQGDLDSALDEANEALRLNPNCGQGLMLRGTVKYQQAVLSGKDSLKSMAHEILDDYQRAIQMMRDYPQAYVNRAQILTNLGDFEAAIVDIKHAIELQPRAGYYFELGNVYYRSQNFQAARENYQKSISLNRNNFKAHCGLADFYFNKGDWKNAAAEYLSANRIHESGYAFGQLGWAYFRLGRFEEAKKNFNTALRYNPYDFISHHGLARSYVSLKDFQSALDSYNQTLTFVPQNNLESLAELYRERAEVYRQLKQEKLAEEDEKQVETLEQ